MINTEIELPKGWRTVLIGDVLVNAQSGFACGIRDKDGVIQLRMNNVNTNGDFLWEEFIRVPFDKKILERYKLNPGDVVFNNTNSTELVGKSALFQGFSEDVVYSNHFTRLRVNENKCDSAFLSFWLNKLWKFGVFKNICNRWIGQSAVKSDKLFSHEIPLPPLPEQKRIAAILTEQLVSVEKARKASEARLEAARTLPTAYLRGVFESEEANTWSKVKLQGICLGNGQYGTSQKSNGEGKGLPVLGMKHIQNGRIVFEDVLHVELPEKELDKYILKKGDLIFNRTNSAELVGKTAIFDLDVNTVFASYLIRFRIDNSLADPRFVSAFINSRIGRIFIEKNMARAIGQVNISASTMNEMIIPLPPINFQRKIMDEFGFQQRECEKLNVHLSEESKTILKLPASLLRQAFSGTL